MMFFSGLVIFFTLFWLIGKLFAIDLLQQYHVIGTYAAATMFIIVGLMHFLKPEKLEAMIPDRLNAYKRILNFGSGMFEILLGILLFFNHYRQLAAIGLIILLILVFPANIHVAKKQPSLYNVSRLFFQPIYILWIWFFSLYLNHNQY